MAFKLKQEFYDGETMTIVRSFDTEQAAIDYMHAYEGDSCAFEVWEEV